MRRPGVEAAREAAPYLVLIRRSLPSEAGQPDANGFIAVGRPSFQEALTRQTQGLSVNQRVPGDSQLLDFLGQAASLDKVRGLYVSWRPGEDRLRETLDLTIAKQFRQGGMAEVYPAIRAHHRFTDTLEAGKVRLAAALSFANTPRQLEPEDAARRMQYDIDIVEEMRDLEMLAPGEQPFRLQYLIRFD